MLAAITETRARRSCVDRKHKIQSRKHHTRPCARTHINENIVNKHNPVSMSLDPGTAHSPTRGRPGDRRDHNNKELVRSSPTTAANELNLQRRRNQRMVRSRAARCCGLRRCVNNAARSNIVRPISKPTWAGGSHDFVQNAQVVLHIKSDKAACPTSSLSLSAFILVSHQFAAVAPVVSDL
jgi:hypothetical protein